MPSFIGWVPTDTQYVPGFFELAPVSPKDIVYDLGCGDGRLVFAAIEKGAGKATGIDIDPARIKTCLDEAKKRGLDGKVDFKEADVLDVDLSGATVIFCYLLTSASAALKPKFEKELQAGARIVMESFPVPGWKPVRTYEINSGYGFRSFYYYTMPPKYE